MTFNPYDYGKFLTLESCQKISINDVVKVVSKNLKKSYLKSIVTEVGLTIDLVTSHTRFGGDRYWFQCPDCKKRVGVLYRVANGLICRTCTGFRYRVSRYKGMMTV
jgi:hypothetical protein